MRTYCRHKITLLKRHSDRVRVRRDDAFSYNPRGRMPWLQRILFRIAAKLQTHDEWDVISTRLCAMDTDKIIDVIRECVRDIEISQGKRVTRVLLGAPDAQLLAGEVDRYFSFEMPGGAVDYVDRGGMFRTLEFAGMKITIVPWMDGILPLID